MSMKVYDAFKVKDQDRLWPVLRDIRERGEKEVVARLRAYYIEEMETIDPEGGAYKAARAKDPEQDEIARRLSIARDKLREGFRKGATSMERDKFDPAVCVTVTEHATGFYLRAFCDPVSLLGGSLDFLETHADLEDFHYQNSSDPPKTVALEAWEDRRRIWDEMMTPPGCGPFKDQVTLEISSWACFWQLDPWFDLRKEFHDNPPTLPVREEVLARTLRELSAFQEVFAERGCIKALTTKGAVVLIQPAKKRSQKNQWVTTVDHGTTKVHGSLTRAVDWVYYQHMNPSWRARLDSWRKETLAKRKAAKSKKKRRA